MMAMASRPGGPHLAVKARERFRRLSAAAFALGSCLLLTQCSWFSPVPGPTPGPSNHTDPPERTLTDANLITAADLPPAIGGGKVIEDDHNARSLDHLSICQPQPLEVLGASAMKSRSFRTRYVSGDRPFPRSSLEDEPDRYGVALQFTDPSAAQRAKSIYQRWVISCTAGRKPPRGIRGLQPSFDWTQMAANPAQAEVAEVTYRLEGSAVNVYHESVGLAMLQDRMMITVHLFYTDESPYALTIDEDEAGFAHPQLGLIEAAGRRLSQ
jgi:hypothetical protein